MELSKGQLVIALPRLLYNTTQDKEIAVLQQKNQEKNLNSYFNCYYNYRFLYDIL